MLRKDAHATEEVWDSQTAEGSPSEPTAATDGRRPNTSKEVEGHPKRRAFERDIRACPPETVSRRSGLAPRKERIVHPERGVVNAPPERVCNHRERLTGRDHDVLNRTGILADAGRHPPGCRSRSRRRHKLCDGAAGHNPAVEVEKFARSRAHEPPRSTRWCQRRCHQVIRSSDLDARRGRCALPTGRGRDQGETTAERRVASLPQSRVQRGDDSAVPTRPSGRS